MPAIPQRLHHLLRSQLRRLLRPLPLGPLERPAASIFFVAAAAEAVFEGGGPVVGGRSGGELVEVGSAPVGRGGGLA